MKRMAALLMCILLPFAVPVGASGSLAVSVSASESVLAGQEIELVYTIASVDGKGLCGLDLEIGFDKKLVEFVSVSLTGFPTEASWTAAGRVEDSTYMLHVFDDYSGKTPTSIYQGTEAAIRVKFRALDNAAGKAYFALSARGAVMGCYFENGAAQSYIGTGENISVLIIGYVSDGFGENYYIKDGVYYVLPGCTESDLSPSATAYTAGGTAKVDGAPLVTGDVLDFGTAYKQSPVVMLGDVNGDGRFNTTDYLLIKKQLSNGGTSSAAGDINADGTVSSADALLLALLLRGGTLSYTGQ